MADVSKERASLQERFSALEAQLVEKEGNLSCSAAHNVELERALEDMNRQMKDKMEFINKTRQEVDGLSQQLTVTIIFHFFFFFLRILISFFSFSRLPVR